MKKICLIYNDFECNICRSYARRSSNVKENTFGYYLLMIAIVFSIIQIILYCIIYYFYIDKEDKQQMETAIHDTQNPATTTAEPRTNLINNRGRSNTHNSNPHRDSLRYGVYKYETPNSGQSMSPRTMQGNENKSKKNNNKVVPQHSKAIAPQIKQENKQVFLDFPNQEPTEEKTAIQTTELTLTAMELSETYCYDIDREVSQMKKGIPKQITAEYSKEIVGNHHKWPDMFCVCVCVFFFCFFFFKIYVCLLLYDDKGNKTTTKKKNKKKGRV